MYKLFAIVFFLLPFAIFRSEGGIVTDMVESIYLPPVQKSPVIDGKDNDHCWEKAQWCLVSNGKNTLFAKACTNGKNIYFLLKFKAEKEKRDHRNWKWSTEKGIYMPGSEREELAGIVFSRVPGGGSEFDAWIWRSARTDPAGFADDLYFSGQIEKNGNFFDSGVTCWYSRYFSDFAGKELKRFYLRKPQGSVSDVRAKGVWNGGVWTVEFSRRLLTGNKDDIQFLRGRTVFAAFFTDISSVAMPGSMNFFKLEF